MDEYGRKNAFIFIDEIKIENYAKKDKYKRITVGSCGR